MILHPMVAGLFVRDFFSAESHRVYKLPYTFVADAAENRRKKGEDKKRGENQRDQNHSDNA